MKNVLILLIFSFIFYSCNQKDKSLNRIIMVNSLNDSVNTLMTDYQIKNDTNLLIKALNLNKKIIELEEAEEKQFYNYYARIQLLNLLGKYKEAFLLRDKIITDDKNNIERIIYEGLVCKLKSNKDSAHLYFLLAHNKCDSLMNIKYDLNVFVKKLELFMYQNNKAGAFNYMDSLELLYPENEDIKDFKESFGEMYHLSEDAFNKLESQINNKR